MDVDRLGRFPMLGQQKPGPIGLRLIDLEPDTARLEPRQAGLLGEQLANAVDVAGSFTLSQTFR